VKGEQMKQFIYIVLVIGLVFIGYANAKDTIYKIDYFSIAIPDNMKIDDKSSDSVQLVFIDDPGLKKGVISILAGKREEAGTPDSQWARVRSLTVSGKKVLYEKETNFAGLKWKVIAVSGMTDIYEMKDVVYFSVGNNAVYMLHYRCLPDKCKAMEIAVDKIISSYRLQAIVKQPDK
jgi:hypothetical protein